LLLVCSSGGHLVQLFALRPAWDGFSRVWVTFDKSDSRSLLVDEDVVHAHGPTNRSVRALLLNLALAVRVLVSTRPRVILTTGAGVAVPFVWIGRLLGARVVYVESATRIESPSLSLRLTHPFVSHLYVQWPELQTAVPDARYRGSIFDAQRPESQATPRGAGHRDSVVDVT
jgi:UDP-N-acetylglucosamine:LPS N-acetylglucosamine transferase